MSVKYTDHSAEILAALQQAKKSALTAIGTAAVEITNDYMQTRYGRPIYLTGDLMRSIAFQVRSDDEAVDVGTNISYAPYVFLGTSKMKARPALQEAITLNGDIWQEIASEYLSQAPK